MQPVLLLLGLCFASTFLGEASLSAFPCPHLRHNFTRPTSVHNLRPQNIKVMMAIGDSITTGFGIHGPSGLLNEFRGESWAIGGDYGAPTLATFVQYYQLPLTRLVGPSKGHHLAEVCYGILCPPGQYRPSIDHLNVAQSGALITDVADQVDYLTQQLQTREDKYSYKEDWKILTFLIGGNDLCLSCVLEQALSPDKWEERMRTILTKVKQQIPRVIVNVVPIFKVSQIVELTKDDAECQILHKLAFVECTCAYLPGHLGEKNRRIMDNFTEAYNERTEKVVKEFQSNPSDDFAVVLQPFTQDLNLDSFSLDMISKLDCFHPSAKTHAMMAKGLWNSMLTPVGDKPTTVSTTSAFVCPNADTLFYTAQNSHGSSDKTDDSGILKPSTKTNVSKEKKVGSEGVAATT